jgi:hypothetical protein
MSPKRFVPGPSPTRPDEAVDSRNERLAEAGRKIQELFEELTGKFGLSDAQHLFRKTLKRSYSGQGRPPETERSADDSLLLRVYDGLAGDPNPETLQQFPVDLNQDGSVGPGEALWH